TEPRNARSKLAPTASHSSAPVSSRTKNAATAVSPKAVRKWTRKKRGLTCAAESKTKHASMPAASRRQKTATMSASGVDQRHQLGPRGLVGAEGAAHGAGGAQAVRLADAADGHAGVDGFKNHADAAGVQLLHEQVS